MGNPVKNSISTINPDSAVICPDCFINRIGAIKKVKKVLAQYGKICYSKRIISRWFTLRMKCLNSVYRNL